MEYQTTTSLLPTAADTVPRFITKKWIEVRDQFGGSCKINQTNKF